jgi:phenylpropionate dioxygenase-like ring-hydroxylating dioxygenase large terminal subunit
MAETQARTEHGESPATAAAQVKRPTTLPPELVRPDICVADVLRRDPVPPPATLLQNTQTRLGTDPIPAARYYSHEFHELERERLWPKVWQFACWAYDIPKAGDVEVYRILERSVLIVRQRDGSLKAFINACLHRGREICEHSGRRAQLRCPYHYFTWNLNGQLDWVPSQWDFPQLNAEKFQLPEIRVAVWNGFVFVNFDQDAPPLEAYLGRLIQDWDGWDFNQRYKSVHVEKRIRCNWKTGQDAFIEGFHSYASHPQFILTVPDDCSQQDVYAGEPHINRNQFVVGIPSPRLNPQPSDEQVFEALCAGILPQAVGTEEGRMQAGETIRAATARVAGKSYLQNFGFDASRLSTSETIDPISYFVFPNFMPWPSLSYPLVYRFRPDEDPNWCIWDTMIIVPFAGERPPSAPVVRLGPEDSFEDVPALGALGRVLQQDAAHLPALQRGMRNLVCGQLNLTEYQEVRIRHYHQTLQRYLNI